MDEVAEHGKRRDIESFRQPHLKQRIGIFREFAALGGFSIWNLRNGVVTTMKLLTAIMLLYSISSAITFPAIEAINFHDENWYENLEI